MRFFPPGGSLRCVLQKSRDSLPDGWVIEGFETPVVPFAAPEVYGGEVGLAGLGEVCAELGRVHGFVLLVQGHFPDGFGAPRFHLEFVDKGRATPQQPD